MTAMTKMKSIGEARFAKLSAEDKKKVLENEDNIVILNTVRAMCDPHSRLSDYKDRMEQLASAFYTMSPTKRLKM